ncbi:MAG TPA: LysE family translocator [Trebonia sp.]|nr:LysE family translocator [Trebonia sp.]
MSYLPHLALLAGIWTLVVMSPGPDFVVTVSRAASSRRAGLAAAAGIVAGTAVWASASAVGLAVVLAHYRWVAEVVRLAGAGYLTWLGIRMIVLARRPIPAEDDGSGGPGLGAAWRAGLLADLGNPKAAVFWTGLFAAVLPTASPLPVRVAAIGVAVAVAAGWYSAVACAFSLAVVGRWYRRGKKWVDRATGGVLIGLAARLATER